MYIFLFKLFFENKNNPNEIIIEPEKFNKGSSSHSYRAIRTYFVSTLFASCKLPFNNHNIWQQY